jgi:Cof subfamily protein (haloacid dehalogenase superfamily)
MKIGLMALDLDGTVLGPTLAISSAVVGAVERARMNGVVSTLVTGRMFRAAAPFARTLGITGPIVCYQGAAIFEAASGERRFHLPLEPREVADLLAFAKSEGVRALCYHDDRFYAGGDDEYVRLYAHVSGATPVIVASLEDEFADRPSTKMTLVMDPARTAGVAERLRAAIGTRAYVTRSNPEFVEVMNAGVHKGRAFATVASELGIPMDRTLAIGDSYNDVPLLEAAAIGIAMGSSPQELKAVALATVADAEHDGVAEAIERFVLADAEPAD